MPTLALLAGHQRNPTFSTLAAGSSDPHPPRAFPAVQSPCSPVPPSLQVRDATLAFRALGEPLSRTLGAGPGLTHQAPTKGPSCPALPHPQPGSRFQPAQDSLLFWEADTDSRDTPRPPVGPQTLQPCAPRIPHTEYQLPTSLPPNLHPQPLRGHPRIHPGPDPCRGLTLKDLIPAPSGVSPPTGAPLPNSPGPFPNESTTSAAQTLHQ